MYPYHLPILFVNIVQFQYNNLEFISILERGLSRMTEENTKIREAPIKKVFFSYLIPAVLGMVFMSINIVVDGIFIGHSVGPNGLAAVNIAVPIFSIF